MVRDGEDLKVVASNLIMDHISQKAKKVLEALEDKGINAVIQQCGTSTDNVSEQNPEADLKKSSETSRSQKGPGMCSRGIRRELKA